jgi:hypothetical protein
MPRIFTPAALAAAALVTAATQPCSLCANQRWPDERAAGPFVCHANFSLAPHQDLLAETAQLQRDVMNMLGIRPCGETIHLFLFERKTTYENYVKHYFPNTPYRRALFIKERGPGMVFAYRGSEFEVDVRHECTHALLHAALPMVPLWLDEGLAEYFEAPPNRRAHGHPHMAAVKWNVRFGRRPRIENLEQIEDVSRMGQLAYREAWAWTHFMLHGPAEARDELVRFLADIQAHSPPGLLSRRLRRRLPDLERRFVEHFTRRQRPTR